MESNLLKETLKVLQDNNKTESDVEYCFYHSEVPALFTWVDFKELAADTNYYSGYGGQEIEPTLRIYFKDGSYLYRREYDGSEWWSYETVPDRDLTYIKPKTLKAY